MKHYCCYFCVVLLFTNFPLWNHKFSNNSSSNLPTIIYIYPLCLSTSFSVATLKRLSLPLYVFYIHPRSSTHLRRPNFLAIFPFSIHQHQRINSPSHHPPLNTPYILDSTSSRVAISFSRSLCRHVSPWAERFPWKLLFNTSFHAFIHTLSVPFHTFTPVSNMSMTVNLIISYSPKKIPLLQFHLTDYSPVSSHVGCLMPVVFSTDVPSAQPLMVSPSSILIVCILYTSICMLHVFMT